MAAARADTLLRGTIVPAMPHERSPANEVSAPKLVHPGKYRPDIDGLRAISVMAVILFHLMPRHFKAGGIGVDIFLVISGYLIGGIVLASLDRGGFSFAEFYLRRVRRIVPAFIVMVLASALAGLALFFPSELDKFARSGLSAVAGVANIFFYFRSDYFADNSSAPLLHTWSLGVEEQFYLFFPALALVGSRFLGPKRLLAAFAVLLAVSLAISQRQVTADAAGAFYLLPSRAWELMLGVIAVRLHFRAFERPVVREIAAATGLALILASLALLDPAKGFPGIWAIPPCLGAALLLVSGQSGPGYTHRLLSIRPMRIVGLASYSLYLWHWPVTVFLMHYLVIGKLVAVDAAKALALTMIFGLLSWRYIEAPFRSRAMPAKRLLAICGALAVTAVAMLGTMAISNGFPGRFSARALALDALPSETQRYQLPKAHCFLTPREPFKAYDRQRCLTPVAGQQNWVLLGDSHAAMLYGALDKLPGIRILPAITYACDIRLRARADGTGCADLVDHIVQHYVRTAPIAGVIVTSRWEVVEPDALAWLQGELAARGLKLVVIGPAPEYSVPVARVMAEAERRGDPALAVRSLETWLWSIDARLDAASRQSGFAYLSPMQAMCSDRVTCTLSNKQGMPLYSDGTHYTDEGAGILLQRLQAIDAERGSPMQRSFATAPASPR